jgi:uncharacterized protein YecE (DUF72 family)
MPIIGGHGEKSRKHQNRHFGLALHTVAWSVLSGGFAAAARTALRIACVADDRDQRLVLFAAVSGQLSPLVRGHTGRFHICGQGPALHHAHEKLKDVEAPLANFFASGVFNLGRKLGPILWQFPPNFGYDPARLTKFFELLPRDTADALKLARKRDARMKGRSKLAIDANRPLRHAIEIRHTSFCDPSFIELLREHNIALVIAETAKRFPMMHDITADFVYMRLHGDKELYRSGYSDRALDRWARRISAWHRGSEPRDAQKILKRKPPTAKPRDIYCYFDNTDVKLRAPVDAQTLIRKLNGLG